MPGEQAAKATRAKHKGGSSKGADSTDPKIYRPIDGNVSYGRGWEESSKGVHGMTGTSGHMHWHSGVDAGVPGGTACVAPTDGKITMSTLHWSDGGMVHFQFTKDTGDIKAGTIIGWGHIQASNVSEGEHVKGGKIVARSGVPSGGAHVHFVQVKGGENHDGDGNTDPTPLLKALQNHGTTSTAGGSTDSSGGSGGGGSDSSSGAEDVLSTAKAASFATELQLPGILEMQEALALQGQKSLLNDKPLLPFVQQLCEASLRSFQSMPDGSFFAFYPDYFGELKHRPAYWLIDDIEILDGGINLSDDNLITHMYVVGDAAVPFAGNTQMNNMMSAGVITIFNAFGSDMLDKTNSTDAKTAPDANADAVVRKDEAISFLQRYGARPALEEMPMIKSHLYEMFLSYQKFMLGWSRQFQTPFTFTFMPEVYPGGKVAFPEHNLQMYVEEVEHSWSYESGFVTQASLSAPSAYYVDQDQTTHQSSNLPPNMIRAIVDPVASSDPSAPGAPDPKANDYATESASGWSI